MLQQVWLDNGVNDIIRAYNVRHRDVVIGPEISPHRGVAFLAMLGRLPSIGLSLFITSVQHL
jgi:hypothetical protein